MKAITTKYHGPTNLRGSRVSAFDGDNRIFVSFDYASHDPHRDAALALCRKLNWTGKLISGGTKEGNVFVFLPHDLMLASKGRRSVDVLDLSMSDEEINNLGRMIV